MNIAIYITRCAILAAVLLAGCASPHAGRLASIPRMQVAPAGAVGLTARWFGVSTLLISDGKTAIMIDGFFSRPEKTALLFSTLAPNQDRIRQALLDGKVGGIDAILVSHSHYDHAMDAPSLAILKGALLVGSESTMRIGREAGVGRSLLCPVNPGDRRKVGDFDIEIFDTPHAPTLIEGTIPDSFSLPAHFYAYKLGASYSFLLRHPLGNVLVVPSANSKPAMLPGAQADVVFLGIGRLGKRGKDYMARYWDEAVEKPQARLVIPVHWDDFTQPFATPLATPPMLVDNVDHTLGVLEQFGRAMAPQVPVKLMPLHDAVLLPTTARKPQRAALPCAPAISQAPATAGAP